MSPEPRDTTLGKEVFQMLSHSSKDSGILKQKRTRKIGLQKGEENLREAKETGRDGKKLQKTRNRGISAGNPGAPKAIKSQVVADLLAQFPSGDYEPVNEELRGEVHTTMASKESFWTLSFDGAAARGKGGTRIVLISKSGEKLYLSYKLDFHCSNNEAEYEALILGLIAAEKHNIKKIWIRGDSMIIVKQVSRQFVLKEPTLATYRTTVQRLLDKFQKVEIEHVPRSDNKFSDALATLGARVDIPEEEATIIIKKRTEPSIMPKDKDLLEDWRGEVLEQLRSKVGKLTMAKLAQFIIIQGEL
ncbi:uncharacterized protein LOC114301947 [Camellia sinensis]|uniref:uncharacterized protein LOC114301947 n=1 Tax=Camellia sinensis TaxID=4442 RepID=UPI001036E097|nr:uncharacterized protein LOC114301947 [Camellia sinensis]